MGQERRKSPLSEQQPSLDSTQEKGQQRINNTDQFKSIRIDTNNNNDTKSNSNVRNCDKKSSDREQDLGKNSDGFEEAVHFFSSSPSAKDYSNRTKQLPLQPLAYKSSEASKQSKKLIDHSIRN